MVRKTTKRRKKAHFPIPQKRARPIHHRLGKVAIEKKPLIIGAITIVSILLLSLLIYFSPQFVGQAYYTGVKGTVGVVEPSNLVANEPFPINIGVNIGPHETVALGFQLNLGQLELAGTCEDSVVSNLAGNPKEGYWPIESVSAKCAIDETTKDLIINFQHFTLNADDKKTGAIDIATINLAGTETGDYPYTFENLEIIDYETVKDIFSHADEGGFFNDETQSDFSGNDVLTVSEDVECTDNDGCESNEICKEGTCISVSTEFDCTDGEDNDGDLLTDCFDEDCEVECGIKTITGKKISLKEMPFTGMSENLAGAIFVTKITALEDVSALTVYTSLRIANVPLGFKKETIPPMSAGDAYLSYSNYNVPANLFRQYDVSPSTFNQAISKEITVYDKRMHEEESSVYGNLKKEYDDLTIGSTE
jgi:hypothetical protein